MNTANSDLLTLVLCYYSHMTLTTKERSLKLSRCAKYIRDKTNDLKVREYCKSIIKGTSSGHYDRIMVSIRVLNDNLWGTRT